VVVEMGGRLDATNVIPDEAMLVSALIAVDLHSSDIPSRTSQGGAGIARKDRPLGPRGGECREKCSRGRSRASNSSRRAQLGRQSRRIKGTEVIFLVSLVQGTTSTAGEVFVVTAGERHSCTNPSVWRAPAGQPRNRSDNHFFASIPSVKHSFQTSKSSHSRDNSTRNPVCTLAWATFFSLGNPSHSLVVLADGAHNPASSATPGAYLAHLLSLARRTRRSISRAIPLAQRHRYRPYHPSSHRRYLRTLT
jgi:dihydrofolate synthase